MMAITIISSTREKPLSFILSFLIASFSFSIIKIVLCCYILNAAAPYLAAGLNSIVIRGNSLLYRLPINRISAKGNAGSFSVYHVKMGSL